MPKGKFSSITFDRESFDEGMRAVFNAVCDELRKDGITRGEAMNMAIHTLGHRFLGEDLTSEISKREIMRLKSLTAIENSKS